MKKTLERRNALKAKKSLLEETLQLKLDQFYELCLQEAVSRYSLNPIYATL